MRSHTDITFLSVIEIAYKNTIRNRHSETPDASLLPKEIRRHFGVEKPSFCTPKFSDSLDYANRWRSPHTEPACHGDRKSFSTRCEISSPAKELDITFRLGIGIPYVTTIRNRHSEMVDTALVLRNSVQGPKFRPRACVIVHRQSYPSIRRGYLSARKSEPPARPQFGIRTLTRSVKGRIPRFPVQRKIPLRERGRGPLMRSHTDTSSLKQAELFARLSESFIRP
ncbi:hypothetical protein Taro_007136 [Colocasia esculenta]|uniref:Uncharacterized protein n=1 Tax=Colocasia esculenta TaxID=4460 RepID=A0A843TU97_COLES|nr:hypothetical protein [Colocasia esculenta]